MNINSNKPPETQGPGRSAQPLQNVQKPAAAESNNQAGQAKKVQPADTVKISDRSKEVSDITAAVSQVPDVRTDRVEQLKQSVESGAYSVDSRKVAERILQEL